MPLYKKWGVKIMKQLFRVVFVIYSVYFFSMKDVVDFDILPMLSEYWFDESSKLQRWENILHGVFQ